VGKGVWAHIVITWDWESSTNKSVNFYVNGVEKDICGGDISQWNTVMANSDNWTIGYEGGGHTARDFNGSIDEPMIFNRALSADEVLALYNGTAISHTSTIADGAHTYKAYSSDLSGNVGVSSTNSFVVDSAPPTTIANGNGYTFGTESGDNVTATLTCQDSSSGCGTTLYCIDTGTDDSCTPNISNNTIPVPVFSTTGTFHLRYLSTDAANNPEPSIGSSEIIINKTLAWYSTYKYRKKITISKTNMGETLASFRCLSK